MQQYYLRQIIKKMVNDRVEERIQDIEPLETHTLLHPPPDTSPAVTPETVHPSVLPSQ